MQWTGAELQQVNKTQFLELLKKARFHTKMELVGHFLKRNMGV